MDKKELAVCLLKVFGYVNAKEEDIVLIESSFNHLLLEFCLLKFKFTRKNNAWVIETV